MNFYAIGIAALSLFGALSTAVLAVIVLSYADVVTEFEDMER